MKYSGGAQGTRRYGSRHRAVAPRGPNGRRRGGGLPSLRQPERADGGLAKKARRTQAEWGTISANHTDGIKRIWNSEKGKEEVVKERTSDLCSLGSDGRGGPYMNPNERR